MAFIFVPADRGVGIPGGNSLVGSTPFLLEFVDPLLQGLHHAPQDHRELLVVQGQQLAVAHGLAERLAQFPGRQDVLGDEADLILVGPSTRS